MRQHDATTKGEEAPAAQAPPGRAASQSLTTLHQTIGNRAVGRLLQRSPPRKPQGGTTEYYAYQVLVPSDVTTLDAMYRLFERVVYGREVHHDWDCGSYCDMSKNTGKVIRFLVHRSNVASGTDPADEEKRQEHKEEYLQLGDGEHKRELTDEVNRRYYEVSGDKPGTKIKSDERGKARTWEQQLSDVLEEQQTLEDLPGPVKELMGPASSYKPKDYQQLLRIAKTLEQFAPEDFAVYKLLVIRATDDLDLFERSVALYLSRKEELRKALAEELGKARKEPTLQDKLDEQLADVDPIALKAMTEEERYALAREKTSQLTAAQLKHMKEHPGEVAKDFVKSATLMNTPETFSAIGKDLQEAASGDANAFARWAAGTGAGAKLSGWLRPWRASSTSPRGSPASASWPRSPLPPESSWVRRSRSP